MEEENVSTYQRRLIDFWHFGIDGFLQRISPKATQTTCHVASFLKVWIVLYDDSIFEGNIVRYRYHLLLNGMRTHV